MPKGILRQFGRSDNDLTRAEDYARDTGGGETDGAVYVVEVFNDQDVDESRNGVIWAVSSDRYDELVKRPDVVREQQLHCFGFDEDPNENEENDDV